MVYYFQAVAITGPRFAAGLAGGVVVLACSAKGEGQGQIAEATAAVVSLAWFVSSVLTRDPLALVVAAALVVLSALPAEKESGCGYRPAVTVAGLAVVWLSLLPQGP